MAYEKQIKISKDGQDATIMESSWRTYERLGWTRTDDGSSEAAPPETVPPSAGKSQAQTEEG